MSRYRLLEMLAFISTEIHKAFKPFFKADSTETEKTAAGDTIARRFSYLAERMKEDYLFGPRFTVADAYLFVMCLWAQKNGVTLPDPLPAFVARMKGRPAVKLALQHEGLAEPAAS
jgi:glutathione S-transferase